MKIMHSLPRMVFAALCMGIAVHSTILAQERRTFTPDDQFSLEQITGVAISPDGQNIVYTKRGSILSALEMQGMHPSLNENSDLYRREEVWLAPVAGGAPINLTGGGGSAFTEPKWAPDGEHLAMLSNRGGITHRLWVWEKSTGQLRPVSERGVWRFFWLDSHRLVSVLLSEFEQRIEDSPTNGREVEAFTQREWPKQWRGREPTASVLESGVAANLNERPHEQISIIDLKTGWKPIASVIRSYWAFRPSADESYFAFEEQIAVVPPNPDKLIAVYGDRLSYGIIGTRWQLMIGDNDGRVVGLPGAKFVVPGSFRWSPSGHRIAFLGVRPGEEGTIRLFSGEANRMADVVSLPDLDPQDIVWVDRERLLVLASKDNRKDWWLVTPGQPPRNLTTHLKTSPGQLLPAASGQTFVGVADGDVWRVDVDSGACANLTADFRPEISRMILPDRPSRDRGFVRVVVAVSSGETADYYRLDLGSGSLKLIVRPSGVAELVDYNPATDVAVFVAVERTGTYLTLVQGDRQRRLVEMNGFLRGIAEGEVRGINYFGLDGQPLMGWILLPPNYQAGMRVPLVAWVYAGRTFRAEQRPSEAELNNPGLGNFNLQLFAARGYAVLFPSMPVKPWPDGKDNPASDPYLELTKGVLPAIDKAIELGIADPARLVVMGHSFGGYSTMGLVEQTQRFKAAISIAGLFDLVSRYGEFPIGARYRFNAHEAALGWKGAAETEQIEMGNPPWKDWSRYLRNSPLFYVDRVHTPLLIVHSDTDALVNIQQSEELFSALHRQGKRAQFLRYWGEGHTFYSPANIRDFWMRVYAWVDEFCDISRDDKGNSIFDGNKMKSRNGMAALKPEDFVRFNELEVNTHPWMTPKRETGKSEVLDGRKAMNPELPVQESKRTPCLRSL
jgi:dipeptidyl aminopeptidase/acylaminoacyl peptidase